MTNCHPTSRTSHPRLGLTLIEIMVALTMTLIVLGAMMQAFKFASDEMAKGRAMIALSNQIRVAEDTLRDDLANLTIDPRVYTRGEVPNGYLEIIEGPRKDDAGVNPAPGADSPYAFLGDIDDILALTVRDPERKYRGRTLDATTGTTTTIESNLAEVVWWTSFRDVDQDQVVDFDEKVTVFRRVLVIRPDLNTQDPPVLPTGLSASDVDEFFQQNDISARAEMNVGGTFNIVANTLIDLAHRKNRFCHENTGYPFYLRRSNLLSRRMFIDTTGNDRPDTATNDDVILPSIAAFDVKVFAVGGAIVIDPTGFGGGNGYALTPEDVGFNPADAGDTNFGSFADLGHNAGGWFAGRPNTKSMLRYPFLTTAFNQDVFDTWTPQYEREPGGNTVAANGLDDNNSNGVDDETERVTAPPYAEPLRGVKVIFRVSEQNSKQIRQSSVIHNFVPQ